MSGARSDVVRQSRLPIRRAFISVHDKTGLGELAAALAAAGVEIVSTGSTAACIAQEGVAVTPVSDLTGFPECLGGRVKTLHPRVHAAILADLRLDDHRAQLAELDIEPFNLVVVNLYPFRDAVASGAGVDDCVEQIDIGGSALVRAAAKNHASVAVVVSPSRYAEVMTALPLGGFTLEQRRWLAVEAFAHTASYDMAVAEWGAQELAYDPVRWWPSFAGQALTLRTSLRYGENPHQRAALYTSGDLPPGLAQAEQLHGKEMSFNNYVDSDAARHAAYDHAEPCVVIVKHANPCGMAISTVDDVAEAHRKAHACDPVSAFGGIVAANRPVNRVMAEQVADVFTEVVVAPGYDDEALAVLTLKRDIRLLRCPDPARGPHRPVDWRQVSGGVLVQTGDAVDAPGDDPAVWRLVASPPADKATLRDLVFAWRAIRAVKSNAILLATDGATVGLGMGQVNRLDSARLAVGRAGRRARGSVAASDAFFPFADGLEVLLKAGVRAVVQPGGSVRDEEVVAAARQAGVTMYLTGVRHFAH